MSKRRYRYKGNDVPEWQAYIIGGGLVFAFVAFVLRELATTIYGWLQAALAWLGIVP